MILGACLDALRSYISTVSGSQNTTTAIEKSLRSQIEIREVSRKGD